MEAIFFEISIIHKPSLGSREIPQKKIGPDRFSRFDAYWIQTNKHPEKRQKKTVAVHISIYYRFELFLDIWIYCSGT